MSPAPVPLHLHGVPNAQRPEVSCPARPYAPHPWRASLPSPRYFRCQEPASGFGVNCQLLVTERRNLVALRSGSPGVPMQLAATVPCSTAQMTTTLSTSVPLKVGIAPAPEGCGSPKRSVSSRAIRIMERAHEPAPRRTACTLTFLFPEQCESGATFTTASSPRNSTTCPPSPNSEGCRAMTSR